MKWSFATATNAAASRLLQRKLAVLRILKKEGPTKSSKRLNLEVVRDLQQRPERWPRTAFEIEFGAIDLFARFRCHAPSGRATKSRESTSATKIMAVVHEGSAETNEPTSGRNHQMMPYNPRLPEPQIPILLPPSFLSQKGWGNLELGRLQSQAGVSFRRKANKDRIAKARTTRHNSLGLLPAIQDLWRVELNSVHGPDHKIQIAALLDFVATRRASGKILQTTQDPSTHRPCYLNTLWRNTRQRSCSAIARTWWGSRGCRSHCNARARPLVG